MAAEMNVVVAAACTKLSHSDKRPQALKNPQKIAQTDRHRSHYRIHHLAKIPFVLKEPSS
jgi:hypothetical protein